MRGLIFHRQGWRFELFANVVDADGLRRNAGFPQFVLRQGGIHHHPVHVAVRVRGVFAEVDAQIYRLRRAGGTVDDEVAADGVLLQLQHPVDAVDRVCRAVQIVAVVRRRPVRPAGAGAFVAVVHRAAGPAQRNPLRIPAAGLAAVVPQVQYPTVEVLIPAVVVDNGLVRPRNVLRRRLVRHDAASAHGHFRRFALRHRRRPALAVVQNHLVAGAGGERRLVAPRPAAAAGGEQNAGKNEDDAAQARGLGI